MSASRLYLKLEKEERRALGELAHVEMREVRDQARFMLREELERRGLLDQDQEQSGRQGERYEE